MAEENQVTIFTDFDKTMVKQDSPVRFVALLFLKQPGTVFSEAIAAFRRYGLGGQAFFNIISSTDKATRDRIAAWTAYRLSFNKRWILAVKEFIKRYPGIKNIKIVVLTRNITLIPEIFIKRNIGWLCSITDGRFRGDIDVIGNSIDSTRGSLPNIARHDWNTLGEHRYERMGNLMISVIDKSREKLLFIKSKNAFYFGDKKEYYELVSHAGIRQLKFQQV